MLRNVYLWVQIKMPSMPTMPSICPVDIFVPRSLGIFIVMNMTSIKIGIYKCKKMPTEENALENI